MKHPNKQPDRSSPQVLSALTASAMALPGLAGTASAEGPVEETTFDFDYSFYKEDKLRPNKTAFGGERVTLRLSASPRERFEEDAWAFWGSPRIALPAARD